MVDSNSSEVASYASLSRSNVAEADAITKWTDVPACDREAHFSPRITVGDPAPFLKRFAERSAEALPTLPGPFDVAYGPDPLMTLDYHVAAGAVIAPLVVFVHGGYWRALDKREHNFAIAGLRASGFSVVNLNYPLCPAVSLTELNASIAQALRMIADKRAAWGLGEGRFVLMGHSAGAHAAAYAAGDADLACKLAGTVEISGIFDTRLVREISVQEQVRLSKEEAAALNCLARPMAELVPCYINVGENEPAGWRGQSQARRDLLLRQGVSVQFSVVSGANHFTVLEESVDAATLEGAAIVKFVRSRRSPLSLAGAARGPPGTACCGASHRPRSVWSQATELCCWSMLWG